MEFDEEAYARSQERIHDMFPDARFVVSFPVEDFDHVLSNEPMIFVKCAHRCYCWGTHPRKSDFFKIKNTGKGIRIKDAIKALVDSMFDPDCGHYFLEGFHQTKDSEVQFETRFGS
jgi:hypothetical protein